MKADIIVDLQYGDCGKGKVTHHLCKDGDYTHVMRYNGGCNAGHTIFHNGKKFITHHIPAGVFFGIPSIIGPGCVLYPKQFFAELEELQAGGIDTEGNIFIAKNTHIIQEKHRGEDSTDTKIGTTKSGNGPCYRDKYARVGIRAVDVPELQPYLIDLYDEVLTRDGVSILLEGAQGFGLDIDWGDYPYVTSSHPTTAGALLNGIPPQAVRDVWGIAKAYETYVGAKKFQPDDELFNRLREIGGEYGATTGRPRQCNWINMDTLKRAIIMNGVTKLVFNKVDILRELGVWRVIADGEEVAFDTEDAMQAYLIDALEPLGLSRDRIFFSGDPEKI